MKHIVIASKNPVKARATLNGFQRMFPEETFQIEAVESSSEVNDQPLTSAETLQGALNRARQVAGRFPTADYWVGIEGGVETDEMGDIAAFCWVVITTRELTGKSRSGTFYLPRPVADLVRQGLELGDADDIVFKRSNSKQENGAIGLLTGNVIDRTSLYEQAVILALVPFKNAEMYRSSS